MSRQAGRSGSVFYGIPQGRWPVDFCGRQGDPQRPLPSSAQPARRRKRRRRRRETSFLRFGGWGRQTPQAPSPCSPQGQHHPWAPLTLPPAWHPPSSLPWMPAPPLPLLLSLDTSVSSTTLLRDHLWLSGERPGPTTLRPARPCPTRQLPQASTSLASEHPVWSSFPPPACVSAAWV